jgi:hypothetical protein
MSLYQGPPWSSVASSPKTVTYAGALAVGNAIVTALATSTSPAVVSGGGLNGAQGGGPFPLPRAVSVTTSSSAGAYTTGAGNQIVVSGTDAGGSPLTDVLTLTASGGGETVTTTHGFATVTEIDIPAQNNTAGSFTFGVYDVCAQFRRLRIGTPNSGNVHYRCQLDASDDTIGQLQAGEWMPIVGTRLHGDTTAHDVTVAL